MVGAKLAIFAHFTNGSKTLRAFIVIFHALL